MTKRALLVGSSFSAAPIFFELKKRGHHVSVCGSAPADPCHQYADQSFYIDYSDRDALLALVEAEQFDYLVPTCNDFSYISCAWVAERQGFAGFDRYPVATILHTKNAFREEMEKHGLRSPPSRRLAGNATVDPFGMRFPLLVKPVDSFSGRGVTKIADAAELPRRCGLPSRPRVRARRWSRNLSKGALFSHSAFIRGQAVARRFLCR
jgi:formate-dependent phosphoribosylglycinamide formyltransferase (GAR transformylase)